MLYTVYTLLCIEFSTNHGITMKRLDYTPTKTAVQPVCKRISGEPKGKDVAIVQGKLQVSCCGVSTIIWYSIGLILLLLCHKCCCCKLMCMT